MIKYCIFDLDGTLLNTITTITYYVNLILKKYGIETLSESECKGFVGKGAENLLHRALDYRNSFDEVSFPTLLSEYKAAYDAAPLYLTEPYPGIPEAIAKLKGDGLTLAVLSNKPHEATVSLIREIFGDTFSFVMGGRDGVALKPAPDAPLELCALMGADVSEVAFIGDTGVDIETAKNMNAALSVGVDWGFREREELREAGADVIISNASELYGAICG